MNKLQTRTETKSPPNCQGGSSQSTSRACQVFAIIGDPRWGTTSKGGGVPVSKLVKKVIKPEYIVATGDIYDVTKNGGDAAMNTAAKRLDAQVGALYRQYIYPYKGTYGSGSPDKKNHFWNAIGNHEYSADGETRYDAYFPYPKRYFDLIRGEIHFFFIDSNQEYGAVSAATQIVWLKSKLASSNKKWKIVVMHHPHHVSNPRPIWSMFSLDWASLGVDVFLGGHYHRYERNIDDDGVVYFVNGISGLLTGQGCNTSPLLYSSKVCYDTNHVFYGAQKVTASKDEIQFDLYDTSGKIRDSYTLEKHQMGGTSARYRDRKRLEGVYKIARAQKLYYTEHSLWPESSAFMYDCSTGSQSKASGGCGNAYKNFDWGGPTGDSDLLLLEGKYLDSLPFDPINNKSYHYIYEPWNMNQYAAVYPGLKYHKGWNYSLCIKKFETNNHSSLGCNANMTDFCTKSGYAFCIDNYPNGKAVR